MSGFNLKLRPLKAFQKKDDLIESPKNIRADYIATRRLEPSTEFLDNWRDTRRANRAFSISFQNIAKLGSLLSKQNDAFFQELSTMKTIGNFWGRDQIQRYMQEAPKMAQELANKVIPLFARYQKAKPDSEEEAKICFEATQYFEKSVANKTGAFNYLAGFAGYDWILRYNRNDAITFQMPEKKGTTFAGCGFSKREDFMLIPSWWTTNFAKPMYDGMAKFNDLVCDIVEKKLKGEYYSDLPDGLYKVWMMFDHVVMWQDRLAIHPEMVGAVMKVAAFVDRKLGAKLLTY